MIGHGTDAFPRLVVPGFCRITSRQRGQNGFALQTLFAGWAECLLRSYSATCWRPGFLSRRPQSRIWAWWLMPNHVHLISAQKRIQTDLGVRALAPANGRYCRRSTHGHRRKRPISGRALRPPVAMDGDPFFGAGAGGHVALNFRLGRGPRIGRARARLGAGRASTAVICNPGCEERRVTEPFAPGARPLSRLCRPSSRGRRGRTRYCRPFGAIAPRGEEHRARRPTRRELQYAAGGADARNAPRNYPVDSAVSLEFAVLQKRW